MNFKSLKSDLVRDLEQDFDVVTDPDHPFLFVGPDVLVGGDGWLVGLFVMQATENNRPEDLFMRLAISRLAYPDNFAALLLLPSNCDLRTNNDFVNSASDHFEVVIDGEKRSSVRSHLAQQYLEPKRTSEVGKRLADTRQLVFAQSEILYSEGIDELGQYQSGPTPAFDLTMHGTVQPEVLPANPWSYVVANLKKARRSRRKLQSYRGFKMASINLEPSMSPANRIVRRGRYFFELDNELYDGGVPYRRVPTQNALLVDRIPIQKYDPGKWLRSSSFAGFSLLIADNEDRVIEKMDRISKRLKEIQ